VLTDLRTAETSTEVVRSFCSFFQHSGEYSPDVRQVCTHPGYLKLLADEKEITDEMSRSSQLVDGEKPLAINPELEGTVVYSNSRVESLLRGIEQRQL
jgi:hypothetical protein